MNRRELLRTAMGGAAAAWAAAGAPSTRRARAGQARLVAGGRVATAASAGAASAVAARRPNILFILTDDQRFDTIGALGNPEIKTPNLDRLAARGYVFTNAYCQGAMVGAVCLPSRTMMMTGRSLFRLPPGTGGGGTSLGGRGGAAAGAAGAADAAGDPLEGARAGRSDPGGCVAADCDSAWAGASGHAGAGGAVGPTAGPDGLGLHLLAAAGKAGKAAKSEKPARPDLPLLPALVAQAGYVTFRIGKSGNSYRYADEAFQTNVFTTRNSVEASRQHADRVIEFLRQAPADRPFFVHLAPPVPHDPRVAPDEFMKMYDPARISLPKCFMPEHPFDNGDMDVRDEKLAARPRRPDEMRRHLADYYAVISNFDFHVGRIMKTLEEIGRAADTVVIFTSDQGLSVGGRHGLMGKQNLYEDVKPPLFFCGPGIPQGRSDALVYLFDLFPTICDLAGAAVPPAAEGMSLLPVIRGEKTRTRDFLFCAYKDCQRMVRDERWKLIWYPKTGKWQLFDLATDPDEIVNLADRPEHAARVAQLKAALARLQQEFADDAAPRAS